MPFLKIEELSIRYPFQSEDVLKGISLDLEQGERVLILGPSGGGKSTLALALNGIIPRAVEADMKGTLLVDGRSPAELSPSAVSRKIGILFQDPESQFCMVSVEEEILFGLENQGLTRTEMEERLETSLELVGLSHVRKAQLQELSGGMKQKLGIACLLAMDPDVLILDEPTANLDPASTQEIFQLLLSLSGRLGKTLIFIEHKLDSLLPHMERVIVLDQLGNIMADEGPRRMFEQHYDAIKENGIWVPHLLQFARLLEEKGIQWSRLPLTLEEWQEELAMYGMEDMQEWRGAADDGLARLNGGEGQTETVAGHELPRQVTAESSFDPREGTPILKLRDLSFSYGGRDILKSISLDVHPGEFIALVGPNGAGKTTLSQLLIGLLKPAAGDIQLNGVRYQDLKQNEVMKQAGYVFQNPEHQFVCDSVEQELAFGYKISGWKPEEWQSRVEELLEKFHLRSVREHNPFSLSQGQKRRLSVATMLTNDQQLLILDEPTFGQDQVNTEALMNLLQELNSMGKSIIMITHDMELVYQYASKVVLLQEGTVAYQGEPGHFFENHALLKNAAVTVPLSYRLKPWLQAFKEDKVLC
ncbi:ABC transporter ATP-binding protein [Mesobacillus foraminis]|uniref:ABC transporter ATP-binding protein n=1 Tax=Mesobacillus foraminis TaxID=279826 RepID=UPI000EF4D16D|nr:ABC transporter ATP-binding protein [Mesobacillus foraminis]